MQKVKIKTAIKQILSDTITPVSVYLRVRDIFPQSILLESSDYHSNEDSYSFICLQPFYSFTIEQGSPCGCSYYPIPIMEGVFR